MNKKQIFKIARWTIISVLIICAAGIEFIWYSTEQVGKLIGAAVHYNIEQPHNYVFHEILKKYPKLQDTSEKISLSEIIMTIDCYQRKDYKKIGTYSDNLIGLITSDEKYRNAVRNNKMDSISFDARIPKLNRITGTAIYKDNKWKVILN